MAKPLTRLLGVMLLCGALLAGPSSFWAAMAAPVDFAFPGKLAGLSRGERTDYESKAPGLGYSVRYSRPAWRADLYAYDGGESAVPDGPDSPAVQKQLDNAASDIAAFAQQGRYRSAAERSRFRLPASGLARWTCRDYAIVNGDGVALDSAVCLAGLRGSFVKLRLSGSDGTSSRALADRLLAAWLAAQGGRQARAERQDGPLQRAMR